MTLISIIGVSCGAVAGSLLRWWFGLTLNTLFPTIPMGTLAANILGGFLIGVFMALTRNHAFVPEIIRLGFVTGFLGSLTTFSTFSAETVHLITHQEYLWTSAIIFAHLGGSLFATILGMYVTKFYFS